MLSTLIILDICYSSAWNFLNQQELIESIGVIYERLNNILQLSQFISSTIRPTRYDAILFSCILESLCLPEVKDIVLQKSYLISYFKNIYNIYFLSADAVSSWEVGWLVYTVHIHIHHVHTACTALHCTVLYLHTYVCIYVPFLIDIIVVLYSINGNMCHPPALLLLNYLYESYKLLFPNFYVICFSVGFKLCNRIESMLQGLQESIGGL